VGHAHRLGTIDLPRQAERQQHPERNRGNRQQAAFLARIITQQERTEELTIRQNDLAHDASLLTIGQRIANLEPVLRSIGWCSSSIRSSRRFSSWRWRFLGEDRG